MSPRVAVLLSTYNGARWLRPQLDSLLSQTFADWTLWARDDGSSDDSAAILADYARRDPRVRVFSDDAGHLGAQKSFFKLIEKADTDSPYLALCDQDDVWRQDKLQITLAAMRRLENGQDAVPALVHTDLRIVDKDLRVLYPSGKRHLRWQVLEGDFLARLLAQNVVTGCTTMINRALARAATPLPKEAMMHDWWLALVAAALGRVAYLDEATVEYRQHDSNASGSAVRRRPFYDGVLRVLTRPEHFELLMDGRFRQCAALERHLARFPPTPAGRRASNFLAGARRGRVGAALAAWRNGVLMQGAARNALFYLLLLKRPYLKPDGDIAL